GETYHFEVVSNESARGVMEVALESGLPIANGILTTEDEAQAEARLDKGAEAVRVALEMGKLRKGFNEGRVGASAGDRAAGALRLAALGRRPARRGAHARSRGQGRPRVRRDAGARCARPGGRARAPDRAASRPRVRQAFAGGALDSLHRHPRA